MEAELLRSSPMRALGLMFCFVFYAGAQFRATSTLVLAPTTVTDASGKYIDGLRAQDLILWDNNVPQTIQVEEAFNPLSLVVAIQTSANSSANLEKLGDTGILLTHLVAGDRGHTSLMGFADDTRVLADFTANPDRLARELRSLRVRGNGAAALDAVMEALSVLNKRPAVHRRILLVIAEARDRSSKLPLEAVSQAAQRQNVLIYWLTYSPFLSEFTARQKTVKSLDPKVDGTPVPRDMAPGSLLSVFSELGRQAKPDTAAELTRVTGGRVIRYLKKDSLEDAIQAIGAEIHRQYLVSFVPPAGNAGQYHAIRIGVKDRPELIARTRAGYWTVQ
jgi:VWFA-related protein